MTRLSRLRFNFGFLLEANLGTTRITELDYPTIKVTDDVMLTPLQGQIQATRTSEGIYISGELESAITVECVRCLEPMAVPVTIELDDMFYSPPEEAPAGEYTISDTGTIDLAPLVRELALLGVPMQPICRSDCKGLCVECGQNLNEAECGCDRERLDPRLAVLRQLLDE